MSRCVNNGGLDPVAVQAMNDDALLKALTECSNRNAAVAPSPASSPVVRTYARPRVVTVSPDDGDGQAPVEVGTPLLEAARTIGPIVIGNRLAAVAWRRRWQCWPRWPGRRRRPWWRLGWSYRWWRQRWLGWSRRWRWYRRRRGWGGQQRDPRRPAGACRSHRRPHRPYRACHRQGHEKRGDNCGGGGTTRRASGGGQARTDEVRHQRRRTAEKKRVLESASASTGRATPVSCHDCGVGSNAGARSRA